jgi:hypothetical protein
MAYEDFITELEQAGFPSTEALEASADALTFVANLNASLRENGANLPEEPDVDKIGAVLDGVFAEIAAASIFLSEKAFQRVPKMLRAIASAFAKADTAFTDPSGEAGPSVPPVIVRGYHDLASRIEATRVQKSELLENLKKFSDSQETP